MAQTLLSTTYDNGIAGLNGNITVMNWTANGNITELQRYNNGSLVDNLTYNCSSNQLTKVEDTTSNATGFTNGASQDGEYGYDYNGNLTKDLNKDITTISYNSLNLPQVVTFGNGNTITYLYTANGRKLRTVHVIGGTATTTDYCGNVIYENGTQKLLLTEEGYINLSSPTTYYYYLKDHQGNNRVVINSNGTVAEVNHYYPFGSTFATSNVQPYKYNGKELDTKNGLNWYDYGARHYDAALGRWHVVDPLGEKYYSWSSYVYCRNNPINSIDIDGLTDYKLTEKGQVITYGTVNNKLDRLFFGNQYITVKDKNLLRGLTKNMGGDYNRRRHYQETSNLKDAASVFKFVADNTNVEWRLDVYKDTDNSLKAVIATNMHPSEVDVTDNYNDSHARVKSMNKIVNIHSHPDVDGTKGGSEEDRKLASPNAKNSVYHKASATLYEYDKYRVSIKNIKIENFDELFKYINE